MSTSRCSKNAGATAAASVVRRLGAGSDALGTWLTRHFAEHRCFEKPPLPGISTSGVELVAAAGLWAGHVVISSELQGAGYLVLDI